MGIYLLKNIFIRYKNVLYMYRSIYNPETRQKYTITSKEGMATLDNFIMVGGGKKNVKNLEKIKQPLLKK